MTRNEEALQIEVAAFLDLALPDEAVWWHTPNGGRRSISTAKRLKAMGVKGGIPDVLILYRARLIGIELKSREGRASPAQKGMLPRLTQAGAVIGPLCRSLREVEAFLVQIIPLKGRIVA